VGDESGSRARSYHLSVEVPYNPWSGIFCGQNAKAAYLHSYRISASNQNEDARFEWRIAYKLTADCYATRFLGTHGHRRAPTSRLSSNPTVAVREPRFQRCSRGANFRGCPVVRSGQTYVSDPSLFRSNPFDPDRGTD